MKNNNAAFDRLGNIVGDGRFHADYNVFDFSTLGYDFIKSSVSKSETSESVYVYYRNTQNDKVACVRFSWHTCNAVRFGDVLDFTDKDEILYRLGLKTKKRIDEFKTRLAIGFQTVKKVDAHKYEEAELTIQEIYALGAGADISQYVGKLAKGSRYLILSKKINSYEDKVGFHYEYSEI